MASPCSLSIVIPTLDETCSVKATVDSLLSESNVEIGEVLLVIGERTAADTREACRELQGKYGALIRMVWQFLPLLGGALRSGIAAATGSHIVLMFADLESDPKVVSSLACHATLHRESVVSASRWLSGGGFNEYGILKYVLNYCFQRVCAFACNSQLTDFTYGFRLYPASILQNTQWEETDHSFVLESILKPLLSNVPVYEVPATWIRRREGKKHFRLRQYLQYIPVLLRVLVSYRGYARRSLVNAKVNRLHAPPLPPH